MPDSSGGYETLIRRLPPPTLAQTERFASYVSRAHSWYKHLPIRPKVPFVFFLDRGAGKRRVHTSDGDMALVDITDDSERFHYSWMTTQEYRRRFGYWNYHAPYGTSFMYAGKGGVVTTEGPGLQVLTDAGDWVAVPPALAETGTAYVNASVYGYSPSAITMWAHDPDRYGIVAIRDAPKSGPQSAWDEALGSLSRMLRDECSGPRLRERVPARALEAIETLLTDAPRTVQRLDWPDEAWLEQLRLSAIGPDTISVVVKCVEVERTRVLMTSRRDWSADELRTTYLPEARGRQLLGMTDAMNRFAASLYVGRGLP